MPAIEAENPWLANYINNNAQQIKYIQPLPDFNRPAANDYAALQAAYDAGFIPMETVEFGPGVTLADLSFSWGREAGRATLELSWNGGASQVRLVIPNADDPLGYGVEQLKFADGTVIGMRELIPGPIAHGVIADQTVKQDQVFNLDVSGMFSDANIVPDDSLVYSVTTADGAALPWLTFDATTLTFSGTPSNEDVSTLNLKVTATDGGGLSASAHFGLEILNVNDAPTAMRVLADQSVVEGQAFNFVVSDNNAITDSFMSDATDTGTPDQVWPSYDNYLWGSGGNDVYSFSRGDGKVNVSDWDNSPMDSVLLNDVLPADVFITQDAWGSVTLSVNDTGDSLTLDSWLYSVESKIEQIVFADGTIWGVSDIQSRVSTSSSAGNDYITGTDGNDTITALSGDDRLWGGAGNDTLLGGAGNDVLEGGSGSNILVGGSGSDDIRVDSNHTDMSNDFLDGGAGDDYIYGSISNDLLIGGSGNDEISGDDGNDVVLFNRGDGNDWYYASWSQNNVPLAQRTDTVSLGGGISYDDLSFSRDATDLILNVGNGESITFSDWFWRDNKAISKLQIVAEAIAGFDAQSSDPLLNKRIQQFDFVGLANQFEADLAADPTLTTWQLAPHLSDFSLGGSDTAAIGGNMAYLYGKNGNLNGLSEAELRVQLNESNFGKSNQVLSKTLGLGGLFNDADFIHGDSLTYRATLADGAELPSWLTFDAVTGRFSGTPASSDAGSLNVSVIATDKAGLSATSSFVLTVTGNQINLAPIAINDTIEMLDGTGAAIVNPAQLLANDSDPDAGDILSLSRFDGLTANGNSVTQDASGNLLLDTGNRYQSLAAGQTATDTFSYTVADHAGATATATVTATILGVNDAPIAANPIADQATQQAAAFHFTVPAGTFTDIDQGDVLTYTATLTDGTTLPGWLGFDAASQSFSGTPGNSDVGNLGIILTATDTGGLSVSSAFHLNVANVNDAPLVTMQITDQLVAQGKALNLALPAGLFTDQDFIHGDHLSYSASLANGAALPAWLSIDPVTGQLSGTAGVNDLGALSVKLTATDTGGLSASAHFNMTVAQMITGTANNDTLFGSYGNDVYLFGAGSGQDVIYDFGGLDTIRLAGLNPSQVSYAREIDSNGWPTYDLVIKVNGTSDSLRIYNYYANPLFQIEKFVFDDGTVLGVSDMNAAAIDLRGSGNSSVIRGGGNGNINDTYLFGIGSGQDKITDYDGGIDTIKLVGLNPSQVSFARELDSNGWPTYDLVIKVNGTSDSLRIYNYYANPLFQIEKFVFDDGTVLGTAEMNAAEIDLRGSGNSSVMRGGGNGSINDTYLFGIGSGQDRITDYDVGIDTIKLVGLNPSQVSYARELDNNGWPTYDLVIKVNGTSDTLRVVNYYANPSYKIEKLAFEDGTVLDNFAFGYAGNDILQGGNGNDALTDSGGSNLLIGGAGTDSLTGNSGNEFFAGGAGNDTITTGNGADIIAFNRGDCMDVVNGGVGTDNTISLGKGINYNDLALSKVNNDLIIEVGSGEQITLTNWYNTAANYKSVLDLQVMADAMAGFDATSSDPLLNQAVQNFDFTAIANAFDQVRGTSATFMHWSATNSLLAARLNGSDTAAFGGDLAHQYGMSGSFTGMNLASAQTVLNDPLFGAQAQTLHPLQGLQGGGATLQ